MAFRIERVLISDEIDDVCLEELRQNGIEAVKNTKLTKSELVQEIKNYDALIVRSATKVDAEVLLSGDRLKVVGRAGVGVDNIDCNAATSKGILVLNTPDGNTLSAAEHTCSLILSLVRHVPQATASMKAGKWDRKSFMGTELNGKTLAVLGLGRIGREVAHRMQSFGMSVVGYDPCLSPDVAASFNVQLLSLDAIWPVADFITVHTPLVPQTRNLLNKDVFQRCKKGFRVVNCARGGIIEENDLLDALNSGQCGGAGLDVFLNEPPTDSRALIDHPKVISTPHLGASTEEAQFRVAKEVSQAFVTVTSGKGLPGAVNGRALVNALDPQSQKWVNLLTALSKIISQVAGADQPLNVLLSVRGVDKAPSYVEAAVAAGYLANRAPKGQVLNLISAPDVAKKSGVTVNITVNTLEATGQILIHQGDKSVSGVLCGESPALASWNGDNLHQPLILSAHSSHLYVVEKSTSLASLIGTVGDKLISVSTGSNNSYIVTSATVEGLPVQPIAIA